MALVKCAIVTVTSFSLFAAAVDAESNDEAEQDGDDDGEYHDDDRAQWNLILLFLDQSAALDLGLEDGIHN